MTVIANPFSSFDKDFIQNDCSKYKTGTFSYHFKSEDKILYFTLTRSDSTQIEKNEQNGNISKFRINWIDNCTYELRYLGETNILSQEILELKKNMVLRTTIIESGKNYYLFKSTANITTHVLQDTIWTQK